MEFFELLLAQDQTTARREAQQQNSARLAFYRHTQDSSGVGVVRLADPILFDVAFLERPAFTQGASVVNPPDLSIWQFPVGIAGVWQWKRNPKGHWVGAYVYLEVRMETIAGDVQSYPPVSMSHDLLFSGVAFKDLGDAVTTEAQMLTPRPVNFGGA